MRAALPGHTGSVTTPPQGGLDENAKDTERYPALAQWLRNAKPEHPLRLIIDGPHDGPLAPIGQSFEEILSYLDALDPLRIERKRKDFRNDLEVVLNLRAELLIGYLLGKGGMLFAFGDTADPDYLCTTSQNLAIGVEVTTKSLDDLGLLRDEVEAAIGGRDVAVVIHTPRHLKISKEQRDAVSARIGLAAAADPSSVGAGVALPEINGSATLTPSLFQGVPHVALEIGHNDEEHIAAVRQHATWAIEGKIEQSARDGWSSDVIVLVDVSRLGTRWNYLQIDWTAQLRTMELNWSRLPFLGVGVTFSHLATAAIGGGFVFST